MKIGSDTSIYSVFSTSGRTPSSTNDEKMILPESAAEKARATTSDSQLVTDFHSRMARQSLDWADADKDGKVTKDEYMSGQARLAELNERPDDKVGNENRWAAMDTTGKGWVDESELGNGLKKIFAVGVGHLDEDFAERLRKPRT